MRNSRTIIDINSSPSLLIKVSFFFIFRLKKMFLDSEFLLEEIKRREKSLDIKPLKKIEFFVEDIYSKEEISWFFVQEASWFLKTSKILYISLK